MKQVIRKGRQLIVVFSGLSDEMVKIREEELFSIIERVGPSNMSFHHEKSSLKISISDENSEILDKVQEFYK